MSILFGNPSPVIKEAALQQQGSKSGPAWHHGTGKEQSFEDLCLFHEEWEESEIRAHWGGEGGREIGKEGLTKGPTFCF